MNMTLPRETLASTTLAIDAAAEAARVQQFIARAVAQDLNRRGVVLGVSGGIDSAVCVTLAVRALGPERVLALLMPEREGCEPGMERALRLCASLGIAHLVEDIGATLEGVGCYRRRDA